MKVTLNYEEPLCWLCANANANDCAWICRGARGDPPDFVKRVTKKPNSIQRKECLLVKECERFQPDPAYIRTCKYCGEKYVMQSNHTDNLDGGYCYDCHIRLKRTYKKKQPWVIPPKPGIHQVQCPVCGKVFESDKPNIRYCSEDCRQAAALRRQRRKAHAKNDKERLAQLEFENYKIEVSMKATNRKKANHKRFAEQKELIVAAYQKLQKDFIASQKREAEEFEKILQNSVKKQQKDFKEKQRREKLDFNEHWRVNKKNDLRLAEQDYLHSLVEIDTVQVPELLEKKHMELFGCSMAEGEARELYQKDLRRREYERAKAQKAAAEPKDSLSNPTNESNNLSKEE